MSLPINLINLIFDGLPKRPNKGKSLLDMSDDYIVYDISSTGHTFGLDSIFEISAIKVKNNVVVSSFQELIDITSYHAYTDDLFLKTGIRKDDLINHGIKFEDAIKSFREFIEDFTLVVHFNSYVINFTYDAFNELNFDFKNDFIDIIRISKKIYPDLDSYSLDSLIDFFNISERAFNRAKIDIRFIHVIYVKLKEHIEINKLDLHPKYLSPYHVTIDPNDIIDNPLIRNKHFAFTGKLESTDRKTACSLVIKHSGFVDSSVQRKTDYLVLGLIDYRKTKENTKSSKIIKAEKIISSGGKLKIIDENSFYEMLRGGYDE